MATQLTLSQAFTGFKIYQTAVGRSPRTIESYDSTFNKLAEFLDGNPAIAAITRRNIVHFLLHLQTDYTTVPNGIAPRPRIKLSPKTVYNIYVNLSALWSWAVKEDYVDANIIRAIDKPQFETPVIEPFSQDQVGALLDACIHTHKWKNRETRTRRVTADRDRAIVALLLDTGIRSSELCGIRYQDVDMANNSIKVRGKGKGRGSKERIVFFGRRAARHLWRYITPRLETSSQPDFVFTAWAADDRQQMTRDNLQTLMKRMGGRAGVTNCHPHRFRHTFAITYLRSGGDPFTLQQLLGHTSLEMVRRYVHIVENDCKEVHKHASPGDNWRI